MYHGRKGKQSAKVVTLNRGYRRILQKTSCLARSLENKMKNTPFNDHCVHSIFLNFHYLGQDLFTRACISQGGKLVIDSHQFPPPPIFLVLAATPNPCVICVGSSGACNTSLTGLSPEMNFL